MNVSQIVSQLNTETIITAVICLSGLVLLVYWLARTSFGTTALAHSIPRQNNMPVYLPFVPMPIWLATTLLAMWITGESPPDALPWQRVFFSNLIICIGTLVMMVVIISLVRIYFDDRLKGFGLNPKTIPADLVAAPINLLSVWPILLLAIFLTIFFGGLIFGPEFKIQQHQELELITTHSQLPVRILIIITAVVIGPVFEEMLFRGLFQTMIRSTIKKPWLSIIISSVLFTLIHPSSTHWLVLFILAICLGYAYEKSGSLFRSIFIHSLFNAISIIATLNQ